MATGDISLQALISWPSAPLTDSLVRNALKSLGNPYSATLTESGSYDTKRNILQWSTYDSIDHDLTYSPPASTRVLSSSYVIRKALIRKHYLSRCIHNYCVKHPGTRLEPAVPKSWELELSYADELDEMWGDELWDLGEELDRPELGKWWILKPGMADRGMGIRLFHTKEELVEIFEGFEEDSDGEVEEADGGQNTSIVTSQLRHFVIQEYLANPLLLDPSEVPLEGEPAPARDSLHGHKFHLRAYCVASGALTVFLYTRILALFSAVPYHAPSSNDAGDAPGRSGVIDLSAHLTNTSLQTERGEAGVRLLDELVGCHILEPSNKGPNIPTAQLTSQDITDIKAQMREILVDTFKAALEMSVHFQPLPNGFELFGVDFLVTHQSTPTCPQKFQVQLLEVNAEPAIELTGPRLTWILRDLFVSIAKSCVEPYFNEDDAGSTDKPTESHPWRVGETQCHLQKCLEIEVRGSAGW